VQGVLCGVLLTGLAIALYQQVGMLTGGIAGLALVVHYITAVDTGVLFWVLNAPFYVLAVLRMGWAFTVKTFGAITLLSALLIYQPALIQLAELDPAYAAFTGGLLVGMGLLALFRHRASLGGVGILALFLQDRFGWRPGIVQLVIDLSIFAFGAFVVAPEQLLWSVLSALVLNVFLVINHRLDRYIAR
ncbi:MAG: YitT family protein, partial [Pseudomonadota bacterium]